MRTHKGGNMAKQIIPHKLIINLEKDGTFTSTERRVQRVRAAVPTQGEARQDWKIIYY